MATRVEKAEAAAVAGADDVTVEEIALGFASAPSLAGAVVAGSAQAEANLDAVVKPLIGAQAPSAQTVAQLATRFDGIADPSQPARKFPTPQ